MYFYVDKYLGFINLPRPYFASIEMDCHGATTELLR